MKKKNITKIKEDFSFELIAKFFNNKLKHIF